MDATKQFLAMAGALGVGLPTSRSRVKRLTSDATILELKETHEAKLIRRAQRALLTRRGNERAKLRLRERYINYLWKRYGGGSEIIGFRCYEYQVP